MLIDPYKVVISLYVKCLYEYTLYKYIHVFTMLGYSPFADIVNFKVSFVVATCNFLFFFYNQPSKDRLEAEACFFLYKLDRTIKINPWSLDMIDIDRHLIRSFWSHKIS